jgi:hypothetical protein
MPRNAKGFAAIVGAFVPCLASVPALAQSSGSPLTGSVSLGTRSVDVDGTTTKYREDINLDDGVRVFDINVNYRPDGESPPLDDLTFSANNLGGDPFESIHLSARKYGAYRLKLDRRRSDYFYEDTILPVALASVTGSTGGDFHHFDFERVRDSASLELDLTPATSVTIGLDRQTRIGESTTTLDIQRDEFEIDKPLDETLESLRLGIEHSWQRVTLIFEEEIRDFENVSELFLPGASPGQNTTTNPAELQFFFLDQSYDFDSRSHMLRAVARPTDRLDVSAMLRSEDLELDTFASEQSLGTTFMGDPFSTDVSGPGRVDRDVDTAAIDFGFAVGERARLIAGYRSNTLEQSGELQFGAEGGVGSWDIETDGFELGAEIAIGMRTVVTAGWSAESRDAAFAQLAGGALTGEAVTTDRDGYFARIQHTTDKGLRISASIEDNSIDDPFALAAPSESQRYRLALRYSFENGISLQGSHQRNDVANDNSGWLSDTEQTDLRVRYSRPRMQISAGVTLIDADREISQLVTGGTRQVLFPISYVAESELYDVSIRRLVTERVTIGGSIRTYENLGSYQLERDDDRIYAEFRLRAGYALDVSYRDVSYREDAFDEYDAQILELGFRLAW